MPVITLDAEFSFDLAEIDDADLDLEFRRRASLAKAFADEVEAKIEPVTVDDFSTDDLLRVLRDRGIEFSWAPEVYALIAAGDTHEAMEIMSRECEGLAPPSHARRLANLLKARGIDTHVQN